MAQAAIIDKCDLCETDEKVEFFYVDCDSILCSNCKVLQSKIKKTRNDQVKPLSQARDQNIVHKSTTIYCSEHSTVHVTLFCLKCDQLICTQCLAQKHKGHGITTPDEIRDAKAEELNIFIKTLKEKKVMCENAFQAEGQGHSQFTKSIDQTRIDISDQRAKIIEELDIVCHQQNAELTALQQTEDKRYSDACSQIQEQNQAVTSALQAAENSVESDISTLVIQTTIATAHTLQGLENLTMPQATTATYQPGDQIRPNIHHIQGEVNITKVAIPKMMTDVHKVKPQEQKRTSDKNQQREDVNKPRIDKNKVRVKSTITVKGRGNITVIVPLMNKTAWVKEHMDPKRLLLIDSRGKIVRKSVSLGDYIYAAKLYKNGLLVTCFSHHKLYHLSADGKSLSTFSDLSPYKPGGLCVTRDMDVTVCLQSSKDDKVNKVVRLNTAGNIVQTFQYDVTGAPLYKDLNSITVQTTGEVIVSDGDKKIVGVDREGQHLFTWKGEMKGRNLDANQITHDTNNNLFVTDFHNNRVYVLGKDDGEIKCVLDNTQGIYRPEAVVVDSTGQLWVGCGKGKIHIIEY